MYWNPVSNDTEEDIWLETAARMSEDLASLVARAQRHPRRVEVVDLPEGRREPLEARGRLDHARGEPERELVRVPDAVPADEAVLGEDLREVEVRFRRGEIRQPALVAERDVEVVQARLERLLERARAPGDRALEEEPRVHARDGQRAVAALHVLGIVTQVVAREIVAELRHHVAPAGANRERDRRVQDEALAVHEHRVAEIRQLPRQLPVEDAATFCFAPFSTSCGRIRYGMGTGGPSGSCSVW